MADWRDDRKRSRDEYEVRSGEAARVSTEGVIIYCVMQAPLTPSVDDTVTQAHEVESMSLLKRCLTR